MRLGTKKESIELFLGDVVLWVAALWTTLFLRKQSAPDAEQFVTHLEPFAIIFIIWAVVFFIVDLYKSQTLLTKKKLPKIILHAQVTNGIIAIVFFYFVPYFGITPKTVLFIDLIVSFIFITVWRIYIANLVYKGKKERALIVGTGPEVKELYDEIMHNPRYKVSLKHVVDANIKNIRAEIEQNGITILIMNLQSKGAEEITRELYALLFSKVRFIDIHNAYETIFERIPVSTLHDSWFIENISSHPRAGYDAARRVMDIMISLTSGVVSLFIYPLVFVMMVLDDGTPFFIYQNRVGQNGKRIQLIKFRTMAFDDGGKWNVTQKNTVTKVGKILRKLRIDELPQLWNVLSGDISLIGPRPEFPEAVSIYNEQIPYYAARNLIQPGLSGWAQIYHDAHPHHETDIVETKNKLSYDLYYIKNRSFFLDIKIVLKTLKILVSRSGV